MGVVMTVNGTASPTASLCSCHGCGITAPIDTARITGSWSVSLSGAYWTCAACTRSALPEIETGMDRVNR